MYIKDGEGLDLNECFSTDINGYKLLLKEGLMPITINHENNAYYYIKTNRLIKILKEGCGQNGAGIEVYDC